MFRVRLLGGRGALKRGWRSRGRRKEAVEQQQQWKVVAEVQSACWPGLEPPLTWNQDFLGPGTVAVDQIKVTGLH